MRLAQPLKITARPWGPTQAEIDAAKTRVLASPELAAALKGTKYGIIAFQYIEPDNAASGEPRRYSITFYDYTNDDAYTAESDFAATEPVVIERLGYQPSAGAEEMSAAIGIVAKDAEFAASYSAGKTELAPAMPPVTVIDGSRYINIGVRQAGSGAYKVVGVSLKRDAVLRYEGDAPPTSKAAPESCGMPNANQGTTINGSAGQLQLTVSDDSGPLWEMLVIRPSASSGGYERSGLEVRDVKYKGKSVMKRGHTPVLNVHYVGNECGPFRDWMWQENMFNAPAAGSSEPAPGFRILADGSVPTTSIETGSDDGNFLGVAVYRQTTEVGQEVVLVSETEAGWYRYVMEWRFAANGTIRPRFGFGAVQDACVCATHTHNVYWRLDVDVINPANKVFQVERGGKFMSPILAETKRSRSYQKNRSIVVQNAAGDEAVSITPNLSDGYADTFARGDFWLLKYQGTPTSPLEIDDPGPEVQINIDRWDNGESLNGTDVVVWYGAQYLHNDASRPISPDRSGEVISGQRVVGPDIRLIRW